MSKPRKDESPPRRNYESPANSGLTIGTVTTTPFIICYVHNFNNSKIQNQATTNMSTITLNCDIVLEQALNNNTSKLQKIDEDCTIDTVFSSDEWELDSFAEDGLLSDESLHSIIQEIKDKMDQLDVSESSTDSFETSLSEELDGKRCQTRRSLMKLHNKMRLAKSLGISQPRNGPIPSAPADDSPRKSLDELRIQKRSSLKRLIRTFDTVCVTGAAIAA